MNCGGTHKIIRKDYAICVSDLGIVAAAGAVADVVADVAAGEGAVVGVFAKALLYASVAG